MGLVVKLMDAVLFLFFLLMAIVVPLLDAQLAVPPQYYPKALVELNAWYGSEFGDYLVVDKPHFLVGLVWLELLLVWPLSIANLVGLVSGKPWFNTTCLIFGVATFTSMVAIMGELLGSGRASETLLKIYSPFMGLAAFAFLRGLILCSCSSGTTCIGKSVALARKKRA